MSGLLLRQPSFKPGSGESASGAVFYTTYRFMAGDVISLEIGVIIEEYQKMQRRQVSCHHFQTKKDKTMITMNLIPKKTKVEIKKVS